MSVFMKAPHSSANLLPISGKLTSIVNAYDLCPDRNIVVHCFGDDLTGWENLPAAWYRPTHNDIVINFGKVMATAERQLDEYTLDYGTTMVAGKRVLSSYTTDSFNAYTPLSTSKRYTTHDGDKLNTVPVSKVHANLESVFRYMPGHRLSDYLHNTLMGVILHETGHSVFSPFITEDWFAKLTPYEQQVLMMFEELRCERMQLARLDLPPTLIRSAINIVVDPKQVHADIKASASDGNVSVAAVALNSTLSLGRIDYDVFFPREIKPLSDTVTDIVGHDRREQMDRIWSEYSQIYDINPGEQTRLAREWSELFKSEGVESNIGNVPKIVIIDPRAKADPDAESTPIEIDEDTIVIELPGEDDDTEDEDDAGPETPGDEESESAADRTKAGTGDGIPGEDVDGDDDSTGKIAEEIINLPGIIDDIEDSIEAANDKVADEADETNRDYGPRDLTPSKIGYGFAKNFNKARSNYEEVKPEHDDRIRVKKLRKDLENLNLTGRDRFATRSAAPPGRLNSRGAVQRSAEIARGQMTTARPWKSSKRHVDANPKITVGIMTDVSGSMRWAEQLTARVAWILNHAVSPIAGAVAAATFGNQVTVTVRPKEHLENIRVVAADGGHEEFDRCVGTLDTMLNLVKGQGVRILFVFSDGQFVKEHEMPKAAAWVDMLTKSGCAVVWITTDTSFKHESERTRRRGELPVTPKGVHPLSVDRYQDVDPIIDEIGAVVKKALAKAKIH